MPFPCTTPPSEQKAVTWLILCCWWELTHIGKKMKFLLNTSPHFKSDLKSSLMKMESTCLQRTPPLGRLELHSYPGLPRMVQWEQWRQGHLFRLTLWKSIHKWWPKTVIIRKLPLLACCDPLEAPFHQNCSQTTIHASRMGRYGMCCPEMPALLQFRGRNEPWKELSGFPCS